MSVVHFRVVCSGLIESGTGRGGVLSVSKDGGSIQLEFNPSAATCRAETRDKSISDGLYTDLKTFGFSPKHGQELDQILSLLQEAIKSLIKLIKYHLGYYSLKDNLPCDSEWSEDGSTWCRLKTGPYLDTDRPFSSPDLVPLSELIQESLDLEVEPFLGLDLLHRAKLEEDTVIKWILATTAAELAIKKALIYADSNLQAQLIDQRSPTLINLLDQGCLEDHLGGRSSYHCELRAGAQRRNTMVHKPLGVSPSRAEAFEYVTLVEKAIFELLSRTFPNNQLINHYKDNVLPYR